MDLKELLHTAGLKATSNRLEVLDMLYKAGQPLTAQELGKYTYRALKEFTKAGLVRRVDFQHGHAHYELIKPDDHHHHVICKKCEKIEDVKELSLKIPKIKNFKILNHSLEFYGYCNACA